MSNGPQIHWNCASLKATRHCDSWQLATFHQEPCSCSHQSLSFHWYSYPPQTALDDSKSAHSLVPGCGALPVLTQLAMPEASNPVGHVPTVARPALAWLRNDPWHLTLFGIQPMVRYPGLVPCDVQAGTHQLP